MITTALHLTPASRFNEIAEERQISPQRRFIPYSYRFSATHKPIDLLQLKLPDQAYAAATWCFPPSEDMNLEYKNYLGSLLAQGQKLYQFNIEFKNSDVVYVCDKSAFKIIEDSEFAQPDEFQDRVLDCYTQYWNSLIRREDYKEGTYKAAEIILFDPIASDRFKKITCDEQYVRQDNTQYDMLFDFL